MAETDDQIFGDGSPTVPDRRRPGRIPEPNPELIPLFRQPASLGIDAALLGKDASYVLPDRILRPLDGEFEAEDDLRPASGLLVGFAISALFWLLCFAAMRWIIG